MADAHSILTAPHVREVLDYNPETGTIIRRKSRARWQGKAAGMVDAYGYLVIKIGSRTYKAHRLAWLHFYGEWPAGMIDHINGDKADNRIANLRDVTNQVNVQNARKARSSNKSTGLLGAHWDEHSGCFLSRIGVNGKLVRLGRFDSQEAAHAAYLEAKRRLHAGCTI